MGAARPWRDAASPDIVYEKPEVFHCNNPYLFLVTKLLSDFPEFPTRGARHGTGPASG